MKIDKRANGKNCFSNFIKLRNRMKKGQYYIGLKINYVFSGNAEGNAIMGNAVKCSQIHIRKKNPVLKKI